MVAIGGMARELLFEVVGNGLRWSVSSDSISEGSFESRLAAFEEVYRAAVDAVKQGHGICIVVPAAAFNTENEERSAVNLVSN
jgi:hypothetical protein